jgi:hypothetical protein
MIFDDPGRRETALRHTAMSPPAALKGTKGDIKTVARLVRPRVPVVSQENVADSSRILVFS